MSETNPVSVTILDKEYLITCSEEERGFLNDAASLLSEKMKEVKTSGKIIGSERIAVLAALNIAHEMLAYKNENECYTANVDGIVRRLQDKIEIALMKDNQMKGNQTGI